MECDPYEPNYAQGGNEWPERTESLPEIDCPQKWTVSGDRSHQEMDGGQKWMAAREGLQREMDNMGWIPSRDEWRQNMDLNWIWMADRMWMAGDGSLETDDNQSHFLYEATQL